MNINDAIQQIVGNQKVYNSLAKVTSVDGNTCDVLLIKEDLELFDVKLQAEEGKGVLITPTIGSVVVVSYLDASNAYVTMFSGVELLTIATENESLKMVLSDLLDALAKLTVTTPMGPSGTPINFQEFAGIKTRLNKLFKD